MFLALSRLPRLCTGLCGEGVTEFHLTPALDPNLSVMKQSAAKAVSDHQKTCHSFCKCDIEVRNLRKAYTSCCLARYVHISLQFGSFEYFCLFVHHVFCE